MHFDFHKDLEEAKKKEQDLADLLMSRGKTAKVEFNNDHRYDLIVQYNIRIVSLSLLSGRGCISTAWCSMVHSVHKIRP